MKWMIAAFVVAIAAVKLTDAIGQTRSTSSPPVIFLDANAHTIDATVTCIGDNVQKVDVYVDGQYYLSTTNAAPTPTGFSVTAR